MLLCNNSQGFMKTITKYLIILMFYYNNNNNNRCVVAHRGHVTNWLIGTPNEVVACEKESMNLMCDHYQGIRVTEAFWGRDNDFDCQVDDPLSAQSHRENCIPLPKNLAFLKAEEECRDQTTCNVAAPSLGVDMEVCPHVKKFLRVKYECRELNGM